MGERRVSAEEALERLREGNRRYVSGRSTRDSQPRFWRDDEEQEPFAIVLGCSDSRVPAELVLDQGIGDLFVIRVAGNIVAPSGIGSVEFAADRFGTRLVVVLGHTCCGAVLATLQELRQSQDAQSPNLRSIVDRIRPSVEELLANEPQAAPEALVGRAVRANVEASVRQLRQGSRILEQLIRDDGLRIVGAECSLATGRIDFFAEGEG
jgi:carbonic anhydrase